MCVRLGEDGGLFERGKHASVVCSLSDPDPAPHRGVTAAGGGLAPDVLPVMGGDLDQEKRNALTSRLESEPGCV